MHITLVIAIPLEKLQVQLEIKIRISHLMQVSMTINADHRLLTPIDLHLLMYGGEIDMQMVWMEMATIGKAYIIYACASHIPVCL